MDMDIGVEVDVDTLPIRYIDLCGPLKGLKVVDLTGFDLPSTGTTTALEILCRTPSCQGVLTRFAKGALGTISISNCGDVRYHSRDYVVDEVVIPATDPYYVITGVFSYKYDVHLESSDDYVDYLNLQTPVRQQVAASTIVTNYGMYAGGFLVALPKTPCKCEWCVRTASASSLLTAFVPSLNACVTLLDCRYVGNGEACETGLAYLWAADYDGTGIKGLFGPGLSSPVSGLIVAAASIADRYQFSAALFSEYEWVNSNGDTVAPYELVFCTAVDNWTCIHEFNVYAIIFDSTMSMCITKACASDFFQNNQLGPRPFEHIVFM
jgi:hypothetical protein